MERREWKEAEDTFKELRAEGGNKNDAYASMAQGAIPLNSLSGRRKVLSLPPPPSGAKTLTPF